MLDARVRVAVLVLALACSPLAAARPAEATSAAEINREVDATLAKLYADVPVSRTLIGRARGVLVFPRIVKAGFMFGAQYGDGALRRGGKTVGYYNSVAASYGLQAGVQKFGYVLLFMSDTALAYLDKSEGFEVGVGPSVVVLDEGTARSYTTSTLKDDIYAFIFEQKGLMAGMGLQGSKITRIQR